MGLEVLRGRCGRASLGEVLTSLEERLPPELAQRFTSSLRRLLETLESLEGRGVRIHALVLFGSIIDPSRRIRRDSDIDFLIVYEGVDPMKLMAEVVPEVVRLKRLPDGSIDAHTQLLDVANGVAWHPITAKPSEVEEKLGSIDGPCTLLEPR